MGTARFAGRSGVVATIPPHATGHAWAQDGTLLRIDYERGIGWVATHYDLKLRVIDLVRGSDEEVHRVAACWAQSEEMSLPYRGIARGGTSAGCRSRDGLPAWRARLTDRGGRRRHRRQSC
jgi:hypothetical protein